MPESRALHIIRSLKKKWTVISVLSRVLLTLAVTVLLTTVLHKFLLLLVWWYIPLLAFIAVVILVVYRLPKVNEADIASFLNQQFPQLEESSGLLLQPYESLNVLQKLQVQKVAQTLVQLPQPVLLGRKIKQSGIVSGAMLLISFILFFFPFQFHSSQRAEPLNKASVSPSTEKRLPAVASVSIVIKPPAYTGKKQTTQFRLDLKVEEEATVSWRIKTTIPVEALQLISNSSAVVPLRSLNKEHTLWTVQRNIRSSEFYQVKIEGKLSEFYKIEMLKDAPPTVVIQQPQSYTLLNFGQPQQVKMNAVLEDDYGVKEVFIAATTSSGSGEGVTFKEQIVRFNISPGNKHYNLQKLLDLPALGIKPGDELYFYVKAVDNHNQETRSDMYTISVPDTAQLMNLEGLASGLNIKPEYFRSQRQIIIETEQLLKDQKAVSVEAFKEKSNDLGIDQKLLRLRYGKFLGEESDETIGEGHAEDHEHEGEHNEADFGNAKKLIDAVAHKHDIAEDATFFDAETKKQLKATLAEMWKAELRLRTFKPREALPFEYKALRLLKDLQERGRSYVAKVGMKTAPLKPEKRLSGDLSKIEQPVLHAEFKKTKSVEDEIRKAIGILEYLKAASALDNEAIQTVQEAQVQLNKKASYEPSLYLASVSAMNRVVEAATNHKTCSINDIRLAQKGLERLVGLPALLPYSGNGNPDKGLGQYYFKNLKRLHP